LALPRSFADIGTAYSDTHGWELEDSYHYLFQRVSSGGTFYIGVFNDNDNTACSGPGVGTLTCALSATLYVSYTTSPASPLVCPGVRAWLHCRGSVACADPILLLLRACGGA
jgi:hypothetical protein